MKEKPDHDASSNPASEASSCAASSLRMGNILKLVIPIAVLLGGAFLFFGVFDGAKWMTDAMKPPLVDVTGQVLFNGEPLPQAQISTQPLEPGLRGAIGTTDEQGRFSLLTQVEGDFLKGAYAGEHLVTVVRRHDVMTFGVPPLMTPEVYSSFDSSPLRIVVAEGQPLELVMEGEFSEPPPAGPPMTQRPPQRPDGEEPAPPP